MEMLAYIDLQMCLILKSKDLFVKPCDFVPRSMLGRGSSLADVHE
jgi:hypothetical protein